MPVIVIYVTWKMVAAIGAVVVASKAIDGLKEKEAKKQ